MPDIPRVGALEVNQDLPYQRWEWTFERIGWVALALVILAALLGLLGRGPFSSTTMGNPGDPLRVEYNRFLHCQQPTTLRIHLAQGRGRKKPVFG